MTKSLKLIFLTFLFFVLIIILFFSNNNFAFAQTSISYGQIVSGSISTSGEKDEFVFSGTKNDVVIILSSATSGSLYPYLELYNPSGIKVKEGEEAIVGYKLETTGTFKIVLRDYENKNRGNYQLSLYRANNPPSSTPISFGQTITATLDSPVKINVYRFTVTSANEKIYAVLSTLAGSDEYFRPIVYLTDSQGNILAYSDLIGILSKTISSTGTFYLFIGNSTLSGSGSYSLSFNRWQTPANFIQVNFGQTFSGSLNTPNDIKVYRITCDKNDKIYLICSPLHYVEDFYPQISVYDAFGNLLSSSWEDGYKRYFYIIPSSGDFYIFVRDLFYVNVGNYEMTIQRTNNPVGVKSLNYNSVVEDIIVTVSSMNIYRFNVTANTKITVCSNVKTTTSGHFLCNLELFDANGNRITSAFENLSYTFSNGGIFYLYVTSVLDGTGIYNFILSNQSISCSQIDLVPPNVSLIKPYTGEVIESGSTYSISWNASDNVGIVSQEIRLSLDGGATYPTVIATNLASNVKSYNWQIPSDLSSSKARIKIIAKDQVGNQGEATSGDFIIISTNLPSEAKEFTYEYDKLNRLTKSKFEGSPFEEYSYDPLGNRLTFKIYPLNQPPQIETLTPSSGSSQPNQEVIFTTTFTDPDGWENIYYVLFLINTSTSGARCAYVYYHQNTNKLYLRNDEGTAWLGGYAPGSANIIENSYAKLDCSKTTVSGQGNTLTVRWALTFKPQFSGRTYKAYLYAEDDTKSSTGWVQKGTWTVIGGN